MKIDDDYHQCDCGCNQIAPYYEFLHALDLDGLVRTVMHDHAERRDIFPCIVCYHWRPNRDFLLLGYGDEPITCRRCRQVPLTPSSSVLSS